MRASRASGRVSMRVPAPSVAANPLLPEDDTARARTLAAPAPLAPRDPTPAREATTRTRTRTSPRTPAPTPPVNGRMIAVSAAGIALSALLIGSLLKGPDSIAGAHAGVTSPPPPVSSIAAAQEPVASTPEPPNLLATPSGTPAPAGVPLEGPRGNDKPARVSPPAELRVVVYPFGDVWIDGKPLGHAPVSLKVPAGTHEIGVGDGRPEQRRSVQVHAGERESLIFRRDEETR